MLTFWDRAFCQVDCTGYEPYVVISAPNTYRTPAQAGAANGASLPYWVVDSLDAPTRYEKGIATLQTGDTTTLLRTQVTRSTAPGNGAVDWPAGTKYLCVMPGADHWVVMDHRTGQLQAGGTVLPGGDLRYAFWNVATGYLQTIDGAIPGNSRRFVSWNDNSYRLEVNGVALPGNGKRFVTWSDTQFRLEVEGDALPGGSQDFVFRDRNTAALSAGGAAFAVHPPGVVVAFGGPAAPAGWLICAGQAVLRADYPALFGVIGGTYGGGDGVTTFAVPDLRGRSIFGPDASAGRLTAQSGTNGALGSAGGSEALHSHTHGYLADQSALILGSASGAHQDGTGGFGRAFALNDHTQSAGTGGSQNMPPFGILNWIIKT